jgi:hypothetical protein
MGVRRALLGLVAVGALAGCGGAPTPYQPASGGYGYSEQQIEDNRYRVSFAGNDLTSAETVQNYLLYRAAEVTLDHGYDYFTMVDRNLDRSTAYWGTGPSTYVGSGFGRHSGGFIGFGTTTARPIDSYTAYADIVMSRGAKPADDVNAYDARDVLRRLDGTIQPAPGVLRRTPEEQQQQQ